MVACIDFFEMSEICRPKFIVRHSKYKQIIFNSKKVPIQIAQWYQTANSIMETIFHIMAKANRTEFYTK
jgi:hypothetical protein